MTRNVFTFLLQIALLFHPGLTLAENFTGEVAIANDLYAKNKFQAAADTYESLIQKGFNNGYLYYNLGNTYVRMGKFGPAILNYVRAQKLIPRDENLQANLSFAIQQTSDKLPIPPFFEVKAFKLSFTKKTFQVPIDSWGTQPFCLAFNLISNQSCC